MKPPALVALVAATVLPVAVAAKAPPRPALKDDSVPTTTVEDGALALTAEFHVDAAKRTLRVRYMLGNGGKTPVVLFDRGDGGAVAAGKLKAGAVAAVGAETTPGGLVLKHEAVPPEVVASGAPPAPLAARVAAGARLGGDVLASTEDATRVRYCLGVAPFDAAKFSSPMTVDGVDLWRTDAAIAAVQHMFCTPWFDLARRRFDPH